MTDARTSPLPASGSTPQSSRCKARLRGVLLAAAVLLQAVNLVGCCTVSPTNPSAQISLLNWNTYHLFDHQAHTESAAEWIAEMQPEMVALQEVLHVDAAGLARLAEKWGHPHSVMHKENGYPVALTSSAPIEVVERRVAGFHHGFLHARTHGFEIFVVHFWPGKIHEVELIATRARNLAASGKKVLVVGDFNGEIRHDHQYLLDHGHLGKVVEGQRVFDYRITDTMLQQQLVDVTHLHAPEATYTFGSPALIPRWHADMESVHRTRRRIDFVFADRSTAQRSISARVFTDDATVGQWSDHYPLVVNLLEEGKGPATGE